VPSEPELFYEDFGYLTHPLTKAPVRRLADYQISVWKALQKFKRILCIKSQKIGLSTSQLLTDFQMAILPSDHPLSCRGYDQLLLAQTQYHAREHLKTLRRMVLQSKKYSAWLIDKPLDLKERDDISRIIKDEASKSNMLYLRNPDNERQPSRIIGLGLENEGAIQSWKNIKGIHVSDATAANRDISDSLGFAVSRLALTRGWMCIETPPSAPSGSIFELWQKYAGIAEPNEGQFKVFEIPADEAIKAGVMMQSWLDSERERDPINFDRLYMAKFTAHFGNVFSSAVIEKALTLGKDLAAKYGLNPMQGAEKSQGIDQGFGSSNFGICVVQLVDNILQVIMADEHTRPDIDQEIFDASARISTWKIHSTQCDSAQPAFIAGLKRKIGERPDYETLPKERHRFMKVKAIPFSTSGRSMLGNAVILMDKGKVAIDPKFDKLLTSLRTAVAENYQLDKEQTIHDDVLDAFRLALEPYSVGGSS
jgi:hypothetical protein